MKYALIDTANTFFRARHVASRNSDPEEKAAFALHLTLASINQVVKRYGIDHVVICLEGRSWRKDVYAPYKKNRIVDASTVTQADKEAEKLWEPTKAEKEEVKENTYFCGQQPT